jgi:hypothetical protein
VGAVFAMLARLAAAKGAVLLSRHVLDSMHVCEFSKLSGVRLRMLQTLLLRGVLEWGRDMDADSDNAPAATISQDTQVEAPSHEVQSPASFAGTYLHTYLTL